MVDAVAAVLDALPDDLPSDRRYVIALAGPPAAGKTTLADALCEALAPDAAVLGLDAFHLDNALLQARGDLHRKGAPHTFDVAGYRRTLTRLRNSRRSAVPIPVFDRKLDQVRDDAAIVSPSHSLVITEGNYLLLDREPWTGLAPLFDLTVWVDVDLDVVAERILDRWSTHGLDTAAADERLQTNDLPNAQLTVGTSRAAMLTVPGALVGRRPRGRWSL